MISNRLDEWQKAASELKNLARKYGTDKGQQRFRWFFDRWGYLNTWRGQGYTQHYAKYFYKLKFKRIKLLEIGVLQGASLRMWHDFFPNASIVGLDIFPECKKFESERISISIGSQADRNFLRNSLKGEFDIVIDDGSHFIEHMKISFEEIFPKVASGGIYILEDLLTAQNPQWGKTLRKPNPGMDLNVSIPTNSPETVDKFIQEIRQMESVKSVEIFDDRICFIQKI